MSFSIFSEFKNRPFLQKSQRKHKSSQNPRARFCWNREYVRIVSKIKSSPFYLLIGPCFPQRLIKHISDKNPHHRTQYHRTTSHPKHTFIENHSIAAQFPGSSRSLSYTFLPLLRLQISCQTRPCVLCGAKEAEGEDPEAVLGE